MKQHPSIVLICIILIVDIGWDNWTRNRTRDRTESSIGRVVNAMSIQVPTRKTALITGSTDGIGVTTAKNLALKGYNVIIHGRNKARIQTAVQEVKSFAHIPDTDTDTDSNNNNQVGIYSVQSDISTLDGCYTLVKSVQSILSNKRLTLDVLMNNAGVFEKDYIVTGDGLEMTFAVNVMAPFVITSNLLPQLLVKKDYQSRIVLASSISQCYNINDWDNLILFNDDNDNGRNYNTHRAYSESKLFDAMLAAEFATRFEDVGLTHGHITCNSLDPGTVNTKMLLAGWGPCGIDVEDALDQTWLCTSDDVQDISGAYFNYRRLSKDANSYHPSERQKLWSVLTKIDRRSVEKWDQSLSIH